MSPYQGKTPKRLKEERVVCPAEEERREADFLLSNLDIGSGHLFSSGSVDVSSGPEIETIHF